MANEFIIKNGYFSQGSSNITGSLDVSQSIRTDVGVAVNVPTPVSGVFHALSTTGNDVIMYFDGGPSSNSRLTAAANTITKVPGLYLFDRNVGDFFNNSTSGSGFIILDRQNTSAYVGRNDMIYVNNSVDKGHYFVTNNNNVKTIKLAIKADGRTEITGSLTVTQGITGSLFGTASWSQNTLTAVSSSFSQTASYLNTLNQDLTFNGNLTLNGTASIAYLNVIYETASVIYSSGSNQFGDDTSDTQTLIGTVKVSGSLQVTGSILATQSYISTVDYIDFTTTADPAHLTGRVSWIDDTKTLNIDTDVNNFAIEVGHQNVVRVNNQTGTTLTKASIVYINGESGNRPTVATASWEMDSSSATTIGWVAQDINNNQNGYVITSGILRGVNTTAYAPGTSLYLSSSGQYTSTVPVPPNHTVRLGKTITQGVNGSVFVYIMNGYEIGELHDVLLTSATTGDLLMYQSGSDLWVNTKSLTGSYSISGSLEVASVTGSLFGTASWSENAITASYISWNNVDESTTSVFLGTASYATAALTASHAVQALSSSYVISSLYSVNSSFLEGSDRNVFINTGSFDTNQTINGSLTITQNLTVLGSSSIQYITSSQLIIADNIISVNTITPSVRFGGLAVIDSGSSPVQSGSLLFDSQNNQWIFVHQSAAGAAVTSSILLMGPQTFNNLGNETSIITNRLTKGSGADLGEHLTSSNITDTGTLVSINSATQITGSLDVNGPITGSAFDINSTPTLNNSNTQILTRNSTTGEVQYSTQASAYVFNYGLANAFINQNYLT